MRHTRGKVLVPIALMVLLAVLLVTAVAAQENVGYFRTRIDPHVAGVFINGKYYGTAAMFGHKQTAIKLPPGKYEVEVVDPRYKTLKATVQIEAGKWSVLRHSLKPLSAKATGPFGELITEGFGNAAVYLNGKYYANSQELDTPGQSLLLPPGAYDMKIVDPAGTTLKQQKIEINADETLVISKTGAPVRRKGPEG